VPAQLLEALNPAPTNLNSEDTCLEVLGWAFNMTPQHVKEVLVEKKFVLIPDYVFRLAFIHERKQTALPAILESDTGVGKTFLLEVYTRMVNKQLLVDPQNEVAPQLKKRLNSWLLTWLRQHRQGRDELQIVMDTHVRALESHEYELPQLATVIGNITTQLADENERNVFFSQIMQLPQQWYNLFTIIQRSDALEQQLQSLVNPQEELGVDNGLEAFKQAFQNLMDQPQVDTFFRLLIHPGITEDHMVDFMKPVIATAIAVPKQVMLVFFDEVNTASIIGLVSLQLMIFSILY
jgi:hypothetical protein